MSALAEWKWGLLAPDQVPDLWPQIVPFIRRAIDAVPSTSLSEESVLRRSTSSQCDVWLASDGDEDCITAVAVTSISMRGETKTMTIEAMAGNVGSMRHLKSTLRAMEDIAAELGVGLVEIDGRYGWARFLSREGYDISRVVLGKEIGNAGKSITGYVGARSRRGFTLH